jgi:G:T-mismatch repair DNA endonuclease (very short patch repair protein)
MHLLYQDIVKKTAKLKALGYNVVEIWECEYDVQEQDQPHMWSTWIL